MQPEGERANKTPPQGRATFTQRLVATIIDGLVVSVLVFLVGRLMGIDPPDAGEVRLLDSTQFLSTIIGLTYFGYMEGGETGQTFGKRLMNIRVADIDTGEPIGVGRAMGRHIGRFVSTIVFTLGYLWMLWDPEKQTWHDKFVKAVVVPVAVARAVPEVAEPA